MPGFIRFVISVEFVVCGFIPLAISMGFAVPASLRLVVSAVIAVRGLRLVLRKPPTSHQNAQYLTKSMTRMNQGTFGVYLLEILRGKHW